MKISRTILVQAYLRVLNVFLYPMKDKIQKAYLAWYAPN